MWDSYLLPEDVSAADARLVLQFLNVVQRPEDIAEAVEFPNERDVGVRVAARILRRRTELGGSFTSLDQLYAVPYVGPERFTEIVVSLSSARPPRPGNAVPEQIVSEIRDIRQTVDALRNALLPTATVRLWSVQASAWLGQPIALLAHITDNVGQPLVDRAVTLTANWGELLGRTGLQLSRGASLQMRTDAVGMIKAKLLPVLQSPIQTEQQQSLESQLAQLPASAATPTQAFNELTRFAANYRADGSFQLRAAVDAHYREFGTGIVESDARGGALTRWPILPATVQCYVHAADMPARGNITIGLGVHTISVRNWLGAFLQIYESELDRDPRLLKALQELKPDAGFVGAALGRVQTFVSLEKGAVGNALRHKTAERTLNQLVQAKLQDFPAELKVGVLNSVQTASFTLGSGGLAVFNAVESTKQQIGRLPAPGLNADLGNLNNRLDVLENDAVRTRDLDALRDSVLTETRTSDAALRNDLTGQLASKADVNAVNTVQTRLERALSTVDSRLGQLNADVARLRP